jgi:hypothetical protein
MGREGMGRGGGRCVHIAYCLKYPPLGRPGAWYSLSPGQRGGGPPEGWP